MNYFSDLLFSKSAIVALAFILLFVLEYKFPVAAARNSLVRWGRNLSLATISIVASPLIVLPISHWAGQHAIEWRPQWWSGWIGLGVDLIILDCWIYVWHRLNHVVPFLWRFHVVHHLDETLDVTSGLRFHFGEVVLSSLVRSTVIFMLAVPFNTVIIFETCVALAALFHHSNLKLPKWFEQPLSWLIVTPAIHWVHHHALRTDTDSNYATVLSIWDRIFLSRSATARTTVMKIGVEGLAEQSLLRLILRPFYRT